MLKTLIHIGQHKTGTTSIQHFLKKNRDALISRGLYVPYSIAGYDNPSHFVLNVYSLNKNRSSPMKDQFLKKKTDFFKDLEQRLHDDIAWHYNKAKEYGCKEVIWTNEGLYLLNSNEEYLRLRDLFMTHSSKTEAICCFRDKVSYKESYTKQLIKQNIVLTDERDSYRYVNDDSWLFDYTRKVELLTEVFDNVITYSYNSEDNVKAFLETIGYPTDIDGSIRLNVTGTVKPRHQIECC